MKLRLQLLFLFVNSLLHSYAQNVSLDWAKGLGNPGVDLGYSVSTDDMGNVYLTGHFQGTVDFDPGPDVLNLTTGGSTDPFVCKFDNSGTLLWAKHFEGIAAAANGGLFNASGYQVKAKGGFIYIVGHFAGTYDFDPGSGTSNLIANSYKNENTFVTKLDTDGNFVWAKKLGGRNLNAQRPSMEIDNLNNVYVVTMFDTVSNFNPDGIFTLTPQSTSGIDMAVVKLSTDGNFIWAKQSPGSNTNGDGPSIGVDLNNNIYLSTQFNGSGDFDPGAGVFTLNSLNGTRDMYVSKWDSSGQFIWAKQFTSTYINPSIAGLAVDNWGNVYTTGVFRQTIDFDPGPGTFNLTPFGNDDIFVSKLNTDGDFVWAKGMGGYLGDRPRNIALDAMGNVYTVGYFSSFYYPNTPYFAADFDPGPDTFYLSCTIGSTWNIFVSKLDTSGNFAWAKQMEGGNGMGYGIAIDKDGSVYSTGWFEEIVDFNPDTSATAIENLVSNGNYDIFIHKMSCIDTTGNATIYDTAICRYYYGDTVYTESGTYYQYLLQESGCRSTLTLELTINPLEVTITIDTLVLSTTQTYSTYQWLLNGSPIPGANDSTYTVTENGNYSVIVTDENGCQGTSDEYTINNVSIPALSPSGKQLTIYPNPNNGQLFIQSGLPLHNATIRVVNIIGQNVLVKERLTGSRFTFDISKYVAGVYFVEIEEEGRVFRVKLVKE